MFQFISSFSSFSLKKRVFTTLEDVESIKQKMKTAYRLPCEGPPQRGPCFCLFLRAVDCSWRFPVALCFAVWTFPVFLSPVEPLTLQVGGEASHWHRMSEVERQVATLSGRCQRHDEKLGQLVALLQKLQARVDLADGSRDGGSPPVRSVGGWRLKGAGAGGLPGSTVTRGGSQAQGAGGPCGGRHCGAPATPEEKSRLRTGWGRRRGLWVSPRSWGRLQLGTRLSLTCRYSVSGLNTVA